MAGLATRASKNISTKQRTLFGNKRNINNLKLQSRRRIMPVKGNRNYTSASVKISDLKKPHRQNREL